MGENGCGSIFELSPPTQQGQPWTETVLYNFFGSKTKDGNFPMSGLILDPKGNLYGTTEWGGIRGQGTVFQLVPPKVQGGTWTEHQYSLANGNPGSVTNPTSSLIFGPGRAVTGTASGTYDGGGVFSIGP
jgi:uncharacterized repeat protein (TIGR03803 family)